MLTDEEWEMVKKLKTLDVTELKVSGLGWKEGSKALILAYYAGHAQALAPTVQPLLDEITKHTHDREALYALCCYAIYSKINVVPDYSSNPELWINLMAKGKKKVSENVLETAPICPEYLDALVILSYEDNVPPSILKRFKGIEMKRSDAFSFTKFLINMAKNHSDLITELGLSQRALICEEHVYDLGLLLANNMKNCGRLVQQGYYKFMMQNNNLKSSQILARMAIFLNPLLLKDHKPLCDRLLTLLKLNDYSQMQYEAIMALTNMAGFEVVAEYVKDKNHEWVDAVQSCIEDEQFRVVAVEMVANVMNFVDVIVPEYWIPLCMGHCEDEDTRMRRAASGFLAIYSGRNPSWIAKEINRLHEFLNREKDEQIRERLDHIIKCYSLYF